MLMAPEWIFLTFPLVLGALFAAGLSYSVSRRRAPFSRVVAAALLTALACGLVNLTMLMLTSVGGLRPALVVGPAGLLGGVFEALLIGVAAGAAASRNSRRALERRGGVRAAVLFLAAVALLVFGAFALPGVLACSAEERAVFEEFPQYGELRVEPSGNPDSGSCAAYYDTRAPAGEVFAYFKEQFGENGWDERPTESYRLVVEGGGEFCVPSNLVAKRDGFRYVVSIEEIDPEASGLAPGTGVAAHVSRMPEGERSLSPGGPPPGCRLRSP